MFCHCGCGRRTPLARKTDNRFGQVAGEPLRFLQGHNSARPPKVPTKIVLVPADHQTADYAEGPKFAAWLEAHGIATSSREFRSWRNGERRPSFYSVDRILTRFGYLALDLPDDIWLKRQKVPAVPANSRISRENAPTAADFLCTT